ncbi:hypothetical protein STRIP9103_03167 [Streptomyces ipomoeae 91-03]|uniref:Uncharacterized protein n=1 Tax=Streptomyces ipomoeae 91-03 TaxID=698759 RepID=L1KTX7_9ACTN|nr:hypothetical protein STRIP9103_03167 [Streptomyces ipomoeae 91-03]
MVIPRSPPPVPHRGLRGAAGGQRCTAASIAAGTDIRTGLDSILFPDRVRRSPASLPVHEYAC